MKEFGYESLTDDQLVREDEVRKLAGEKEAAGEAERGSRQASRGRKALPNATGGGGRMTVENLIRTVDNIQGVELEEKNQPPLGERALERPLTFDKVADILGATVKHDKSTKIILFASMLLTFTEQEQVNVLMAAESAAGKSYVPLEVSRYFPQEDLVILGGVSPTAFFHEVAGGEFATYDAEKKETRVSLSKGSSCSSTSPTICYFRNSDHS